MKLRPIHKHDCRKCSYIATTSGQGGFTDWYICGTATNQSIIGRDSDKPSDNSSWPVSMLTEIAARPSGVSSLTDKIDLAYSERILLTLWAYNKWKETNS